MSEKTKLNKRSETILEEIICDYIANGEPVGSRSIAKKHFENLSPATIRNVMSDLEDLGFLNQPHTSAGRIPTDKGYRYFVDQILNASLPKKELGSLEKLEIKNNSMEDVLADACGVLSKSSHQTGLVMLPSFSQMLFKHIEFIKVGKNEALAAFISEMGVLQNKIIPIDEDMTAEKLKSISKYLNDEFSGKSLKGIQKELLFRIKNAREHYNQLMTKAMELMNRAISGEDSEDNELIVDGALNLLDFPDLAADLEKIKSIIKTVEDKTKLISLLDSCLEQDGMTIIIGKEWNNEDIQECSLVAQNYGLGSDKMGTLAVLGPKRMDYQKIIGIVNNTAKTVSKLLSDRNQKEFS